VVYSGYFGVISQGNDDQFGVRSGSKAEDGYPADMKITVKRKRIAHALLLRGMDSRNGERGSRVRIDDLSGEVATLRR
jgi:hypothetical protein